MGARLRHHSYMPPCSNETLTVTLPGTARLPREWDAEAGDYRDVWECDVADAFAKLAGTDSF